MVSEQLIDTKRFEVVSVDPAPCAKVGGFKGEAIDRETDAVRGTARQVLGGPVGLDVNPLSGAHGGQRIVIRVNQQGIGDDDAAGGREPVFQELEVGPEDEPPVPAASVGAAAGCMPAPPTQAARK